MKAERKFKASDYMTDTLVTLSPETELLDAMALLVEKQVSGAPVIDDRGNLVGIITERDCLARVLAAVYHGEAAGHATAMAIQARLDPAILPPDKLTSRLKARGFLIDFYSLVPAARVLQLSPAQRLRED